MADEAVRAEASGPDARRVIASLAEILAAGASVHDRDSFRATAAPVRERTGQKGRGLFHPIRLALTGESAGVELDLAVPAIEAGAGLPAASGIVRIPSAASRASMFAKQVEIG